MKTFLFLTALSLSVWAEDDRSFSGRIYDEKGANVGYVNVFLYQSSDSVLYKAIAADAAGDFTFADQAYYLKISGVGYEEFRTPTFVLNATNPRVHFDRVVLKEGSQLLSAVEVKARKPFIEQQVDRMVINVESSIR